MNIKVIKKHWSTLMKFMNDPNQSIFVSEGSSRSGKTYTISQLLILLSLKSRIKVVVARQEATTVRRTIYKDFTEIIFQMKLELGEVKVNKSEMILYFPQTGAEISFVGLNDPGKIHGLKADISFIDEAVEANQDSFRQLNQRTSQKTILAYNPSVTTHWIYDTIISRPDCTYLHSTYKDNKYLTYRIISEIEAYEPNDKNDKNGTSDNYMWKVYGLGERAAKADAIFNNWTVSRDWPTEGTNRTYGLDWGYSNDPTSLVETCDYDGLVYVRTLIYETKLTIASTDPTDTETIVSRMEDLGIDKSVPIICDSATPSNIDTLRRLGYSASAVSKIKDSITKSINIIKARRVVTPFSDPLQQEIESYVWATNAAGEAYTPYRPVDKDNHSIDAFRYVMLHNCRNAVDWNPGNTSRGQHILNQRAIEKRFGRKMNKRAR